MPLSSATFVSGHYFPMLLSHCVQRGFCSLIPGCSTWSIIVNLFISLMELSMAWASVSHLNIRKMDTSSISCHSMDNFQLSVIFSVFLSQGVKVPVNKCKHPPPSRPTVPAIRIHSATGLVTLKRTSLAAVP